MKLTLLLCAWLLQHTHEPDEIELAPELMELPLADLSCLFNLSTLGVSTIHLIGPCDGLITPVAFLSAQDEPQDDSVAAGPCDEVMTPAEFLSAQDEPQDDSVAAELAGPCGEVMTPAEDEPQAVSVAAESAESDVSDTRDSITSPSRVKVYSKQKPKSGCKEVYDKMHFCVFCNKAIQCKISRHLLTVHKRHERVAEILKMEKRSRQRRNALTLLANEGNLQHNVAVLKKGDGKIVVSHRTQGRNQHQSSEYSPCAECHKFVLRKRLWHHYKQCVKKRATNQKEKAMKEHSRKQFGYAVTQSRTLLSGMICGDDEEYLQDVMARMRDDDVKQVVQGDALIRRYACLRAESLGPKNSQKISDVHRVSQGARTLARLVIECREVIPTADLHSLLRPEHMDLLVQCAKKMSYDDEKPSLTLGRAIGHALIHAVAMKIAKCIKIGDAAEADKTRQFKEVFRGEWNYRVNSKGEKMRNQKRRTEMPTIPVTEDLVKLRDYILSETRQVLSRLEEHKAANEWTLLAKLVMTRLIIFNKRRRAEVKDMKVKDYVERPQWHSRENGEIRMAMSKTDAVFADRFESYITCILFCL